MSQPGRSTPTRRRPTSANPSISHAKNGSDNTESLQSRNVTQRRISASLPELPSYAKPLPPSVGSSIDDFEVLRKLGEGSAGSVYKVRSKVDSKTYVIKKVPVGHLEDEHMKQPITEVLVMRRIDHPFIIHFHGSFIFLKAIYIIMEFADGGTVEDLIRTRQSNSDYMAEDVVWRLISEMSAAIHYLHSRGILHRDLNAANIFLTKAMSVKIGDFGLACITSREVHDDTQAAPPFMAPERFQNKPYFTKADIWSFGIVLYYILAFKLPFSGDNILVLTLSICHREPERLPDCYSRSLRNLVFGLLTKDPSQRPDIRNVIEALSPNVRAMASSGLDHSLFSKKASQNASIPSKSTPQSSFISEQGKPPLYQDSRSTLSSSKRQDRSLESSSASFMRTRSPSPKFLSSKPLEGSF
eukprot:TRINITY_DN14456_c0_g1_i1.p1 TRINITY_DN14456_c0_g1~~TRINITY_DN14456_c0_g1_i1.p1  ORF type:complete len:413 (+),score=65.51 TRINITY_DN14456_c0_g1_i1:63-1301(+)